MALESPFSAPQPFGTVFRLYQANEIVMDILITLTVFILGFVLFGLLFYGAAKLFFYKKMKDQKKKYVSHFTAGSFKYKLS